MNKLVYQLARQSDTLARNEIPDLREIVLYNRVRDEKFAELIVNECATELIKWKNEPFPYDPEFGARLIKQHFDIK